MSLRRSRTRAGKEEHTNRPAAIKELIDYMLERWPDRARLNPARIGIFGFSRGGYTRLFLIGGVPKFWKFIMHCLLSWSDPICEPLPDEPDSKGEVSSVEGILADLLRIWGAPLGCQRHEKTESKWMAIGLPLHG